MRPGLLAVIAVVTSLRERRNPSHCTRARPTGSDPPAMTCLAQSALYKFGAWNKQVHSTQIALAVETNARKQAVGPSERLRDYTCFIFGDVDYQAAQEV